MTTTGGSPTESLPPLRRIAVLVFDGFEPIDVWGFVEAFSISRYLGKSYSDPGPYPFEVLLVANESRPIGVSGAPGPVKSWNGPSVAPEYFRDDLLCEAIDVLMIPGGYGTRLILNASSGEAEALKQELLEWVRAMDSRVRILSSLCTGAAILAAAGVLDGQPAATNHQAFEWVASFGPRVLWDNTSRWVDAGHHVTSEGVSAGTDMGFHLVERLAGRTLARAAAITAEYGWNNDPTQPVQTP